MANALIRLEGIRKVFEGDEILTHALDGIHLTIDYGEYVAIEGPSGCGKSTLLSILGLLDTPTEGQVLAQRSAGREPVGGRARPHAQPRDRVHLPEFQPDRRPECLRERRTPADLHGHVEGRAPQARGPGPRACRHGPSCPAPARPALRRSAAARRRGPRGRDAAVDPAGRRAHGQPRLAQRRTGDAVAA